MNDKECIKQVDGKHAREIEITGQNENGKTVTLKVTPDLVMAMYMHSLNDQNTKHIQIGGMEVPNLKLYKEGKISRAYEQSTKITMTRADMQSIAMQHLTTKEKSFMQAAQRYYKEMSQVELNRVSEKLVGYEIARVDNYFRIVTDPNWMKTNLDQMKFDGTIEGMGFTKERVDAPNPIQLIGMISQVDTDIKMHSKYVGMAIPIRNFNKVYGVTQSTYLTDKDGKILRDKQGRPKIDSRYASSIMRKIKSKWGDKANSYIVKMISDLQNPKRSTDTAYGPVFAKLRSNYAAATLTLNPSVAIKQAASFPTAAAELGWGPLMKALSTFPKTKGKSSEFIARYSPLMRLRTQGYVSQETGDIIETRGKKLPKTLNWIQMVDIGTVRLLWLASEYSVQQTNPELKYGTKEFYEKVGEVHTKVIENTQPNYTSLQRAGILRSDAELIRMLNMFKTQPFQNFNILMEGFGNYRAKNIAYKNNPTEENLANLKLARRKLGRALSSQVVASFVFASMQFVWELFRDRRDKYKDEEGNITAESWAKGIGLSMVSNLSGMLPFGSTLIEALESSVDKWIMAGGGDAMFDQRYYGLDAGMSVEAINSMVQDGRDAIAGLIETLTAINNAAEAGETITFSDWEGFLRDIKKLGADIGQATGIPVNNVFNTITGGIGRITEASEGYYVAEYTQRRIEKELTQNSRKEFVQILAEAWRKDKAQFDKLYDIMIHEDGFASSTKTSQEYIDDALRDILKEKGVAYVDKELEKAGVTAEVYGEFKAKLNGSTKQEDTYNALNSMNLTQAQKDALWEATTTGKKSYSDFAATKK